MPIVWNLKKWLAIERDIYRPSELQALLASKAGVQLSLQAVSALINGKPSALRIQTIQALCNALDCKVSDFFDVLPDSPKELTKQSFASNHKPSRLYGDKKQPEKQESIFPDPHQFPNQGTNG
ncbi:helix-turn-helix domain-containing protein [Nostoc sp. CHAB 5784]|uniref:helix-turn-helix domain-containing protein n=1 Tax=Nostoc mirabile TaxID=2907820 RepID=UPI001E4A1BBB|nr:helix-turn-helix domain-containing protein [Nostoc mirabile]MCC5669468.1 helix-turn-helix domain-containing protein [Nostoc mirabile CHAB5784]